MTPVFPLPVLDTSDVMLRYFGIFQPSSGIMMTWADINMQLDKIGGMVNNKTKDIAGYFFTFF